MDQQLHTRSANVEISDLTKSYGRHRAVDALSFTITPGSMLALLGPSGCGKTTSLRMVAGLVRPTSGQILVDRKPITHVPVHRRNIGMLFQNYALFPHMNVAENVAFGLKARRISRAATAARVTEALRIVQLESYGERFPRQLSGGQQQRVALARCLVVEPAVLLLDEPLGALDKSLRESMQVELRSLQHRLGITTIMVTHDQDEALTLADRVAIMRDGRLEQLGTPTEIYEQPASRFVAGFIGVSNFFRGRVVRRDGRQAQIATATGGLITVANCPVDVVEVTVAVRPEAVTITPGPGRDAAMEPNSVAGTVEQVVYRGFVSHTYLLLPHGERLIAFHTAHDGKAPAIPWSPGARVLARWSETSSRVVRDQEGRQDEAPVR